MIAFIDAKFNKSSPKVKTVNDSSLIEVAIIVKESISSDKEVEVYHSYVKPTMNNGVLYDDVKKNTNIKQEDIDKAPSFDKVYEDLLRLKRKYNIEKIYAWGTFNRYGLSWNIRNVSRKKEKEKDKCLYHSIEDIKTDLLQKLKLPIKQSALDKIAYVCDYDEKEDNALENVKELAYVAKSIVTNNYNESKREEYCNYLRKIFVKKKTAINI